MTAIGPSGAAITAACSGVGSGTRSILASWTGPICAVPICAVPICAVPVVATLAFQQTPLTFRAGTRA